MRSLVIICLTLFAINLGQEAHAQVIHWEQTSGPGGGLLDRMTVFENGLLIAASSYTAVNGGNIYFRSVDSGQTWSSLATGLFEHPSWINFVQMSNMLVAVDGGGAVLSSSDNGAGWIERNGYFPTGYRLSFAVHHDTLFGINVDSRSAAFYRSTDTGSSWQRLIKGIPLKIVPASQGYYDTIRAMNCMASARTTLLIACDTGVYRSTNGGNQWISSNEGLTDSVVVSMAAIGDTILSATHTGIYRSIDAGLHWSLSLARPASLVAVNSRLAFAIMPDNTLWFSTDAGYHWTGRPDTVALRTVTSIGQVGSLLLVATFGQGVLRSADTGRTWKESNAYFNDIRTWALMLNGHTLFASAMQCGLTRTTDGGRHWSQVWTSPGAYTVNTLFNGMNYLFAADDPELYRSSDNGLSWHNDATWTGPAHDRIEAIGEAGSELLAGGGFGWFKSDDSGRSWSLKSTNCGAGGDVVAAVFSVDSIWDMTSCGLFKSGDKGQSWNTVVTVGYSTITASSSQKVLYSYSVFGEFILFDRGTRRLTQNIPCDGKLLCTRDRILAATCKGVYETTDLGITWVADTVGIGALSINDIVADGDTLYIATERGVYRGVYSNLLGVDAHDHAPPSTSIDVYPNPSQGSTNIAFKLDRRSSVRLELYNLLGQKLRTLLDDTENAGTHAKHVDLPSLSTGSYCARLVIDGMSTVRVFEVLR